MDRRRFFRTLLTEPSEIKTELSGKPHFRLDELGRRPDSDLASLVPIVRPDVQLISRQGHLTVRPASGGETILSFKGNEGELRSLLDLFGGQTTLGEISVELAEHLSWDAERAFQFVRNAFIELTECGVCTPMNQVPGHQRGQ
jgi:hypothetical protein